jgi:hypothetical protein
LNIANRNSSSPIDNGLNLAKIHADAIFRYDVTKEFCFNLMKFTFFQLGIESNFLELVQNKSNMSFMVFQVL